MRTRMLGTIIVTALLCACDRGILLAPAECQCPAPSPPPDPPPSDDGARLHARWIRGDDGSRDRLPAMHDAQLDADCLWGMMSDGVTRCLPAVEMEAGDVGSYYADLNCDKPLVLAPLCGTVEPRFGVKVLSFPCGIEWHIYQVADRWQGEVFQIIGLVCTASVLPKNYGVWLAGEEMPPTSFVAGTVDP